jgi:hypothetical protein
MRIFRPAQRRRRRKAGLRLVERCGRLRELGALATRAGLKRCDCDGQRSRGVGSGRAEPA